MERTRQVFQEYVGEPTWLKKAVTKSDEFIDCLDDNSEKFIEALNRNSRSSSFLAWVGVAITIIGAIATIVGARYTYLSYIK